MATLVIVSGALLFLFIPLYLVYRPPTFLINLFSGHWPNVLWHVTTSKKIVALTIDDGPSRYTKDILKLLKANDATATFFVIGSQIDGREETLQDLVRAGNELGNHAMHDEPSRSLTNDMLIEQIHWVDERLRHVYAAVGAGDPPPSYFRPGSGFFNTRLRNLMDKMGYKLVLGDIYPHDPQIPFWSVNARHIVSMLKPGGIIICHDRRSWTLPMLQKALPEIRRKGYRIVTISQLLEEATVV